MFQFKRSSSERSTRMPAMPKIPSFKREKSITKGLKGILKKTASGLTPRSSSKTFTHSAASTLSPASSSSSYTPAALSPPVTTRPQQQRPVVVKAVEKEVPAIMVVEEGMKRKEEVAVDTTVVGESKPVVDLSVPSSEVLPSVEVEESAKDTPEKAVVAVEEETVAEEVSSTSDLTDALNANTEVSKEDVESVEEVVDDKVEVVEEAVEEVEGKHIVAPVENEVLDNVADDVVMVVTDEEEAVQVVDEAIGGLTSVDQVTSIKEVMDKVDVSQEVFVKDVADDMAMKMKASEEGDAFQVVVGHVVDEVIGGVGKGAATSVEAPQDDEEDEEDMPITEQGEHGAEDDQYVGIQDYEPSMEEEEEEEEREDKDKDEEDVRGPAVVEEEAVVAAPVANPSREPTAWSLGLLVVLPVIVSSLLGAYLSGRVNLKLDEVKLELPKVELPFELPKMELPKVELPFELPKMELPFELPKMELPFEMPKMELPFEMFKVELPVTVPFLAPAAPVVPKDTPFLIRSEDGLCFNGKKFAACSKSGKFTLFPEDDYSSEEGGHIRFEESERCLTVKYKGLFKKKHVVSAGDCSKPESQGWHFNDGVLCHNGLCLSHKGSKPLLVQSSGDRLELVVQQPEEDNQDTTLSFDSFDFTRSAF